jgi:hypothetical protein
VAVQAEQMKSIVWLASYPKSGNTWLRMFLANYLMNTTQPLLLAKAHQFALGDAMAILYSHIAKRPVDPTDDAAILALRPAVLRAIVANKADINLVKTHNQNMTLKGLDLIPAGYTRLALYIVRNPLDLIISYADHYGQEIGAAARAIGHPSNRVSPGPRNVAQYIGSWSDHVTGWTRTRKFPVCTLRYEDMIADPQKTFSTVLKRMRVPLDGARLERAIEFSSFDQLRSQEDDHGFIEKSRHADHFFRSGQAGQWREQLAPDIVELICERHGKVMRRFGYLD